LQNSDLSVSESEPIILSEKSQYTTLLIKQAHERLLHAGVTVVLTDLRAEYHILHGRRAIHSVILRCTYCQWKFATMYDAKVPPLPASRVSLTESGIVFINVGLDYFGPLYPSDREKIYVLLITCDASRAVHMEVTLSMNASDFLDAFEKFKSRRGIPHHIRSDNAKTFQMVSQILKNKYNIKWTFITERAPWRGGYWERMNRTIKTTLKTMLKTRKITVEAMRLLLCQTEALVNSRPLTFVTDIAGEPEALTPAHFIVGRQLTELPPPLRQDDQQRKNIRQWFDDRTKVMKVFVNRWKKEFLRELRNKAKGDHLPIAIGDSVFVNEDKAPHLWPIGVVTQLFPSSDGIVRTVLVKVRGKILKRPIQRLYLFERSSL
jgi:transposase InsO family protein